MTRNFIPIINLLFFSFLNQYRVNLFHKLNFWKAKKMTKPYLYPIFMVYFSSLLINCMDTGPMYKSMLNKAPSRKALFNKVLDKNNCIIKRTDTALYRLNQMLWDGYDQHVKPVRDSNTIINVTVDFSIRQILNIVSLLVFLCSQKSQLFWFLKCWN